MKTDTIIYKTTGRKTTNDALITLLRAGMIAGIMMLVLGAGMAAAFDDLRGGGESTDIQSAPLGVVSSASSYDRQAAYDYAQKYWNKVCSDGCFWDQSYPPTCGLTPGAPLGSREEGGVDCAHFISCCIGNEPNEKGGGLDVDTRVPPAYMRVRLRDES